MFRCSQSHQHQGAHCWCLLKLQFDVFLTVHHELTIYQPFGAGILHLNFSTFCR